MTPGSEQFAEFVDSQASVFDYTGHRDGIDGVMPRNCNLADAVGHDNVLTLAQDSKVSLF